MIVPPREPLASYWIKLIRANQHLEEVERLIAPYATPRPYAITHRIEGKPKRHVYRSWAADDPDPFIAVVVGDFLFDVRSALDHLRVAIAPRKERYGPGFPIFDSDLWTKDSAGKYLDRTKKQRAIWNQTVRGMTKEAIAILDDLQPFRSPKKDVPHLGLTALSRLNNADKHRELVPVVHHLVPTAVTIDGVRRQVPPPAEKSVYENGAKIYTADREMDVKGEGRLFVGIRAGRWTYPLPFRLTTIHDYAVHIVNTLEPFVRS